MSDNMVLKILEVLQDQIKKIRTEDKNEIKNELGARIDQLAARIDSRIDHLSTRIDRLSTTDLARRVEGAGTRNSKTESLT